MKTAVNKHIFDDDSATLLEVRAGNFFENMLSMCSIMGVSESTEFGTLMDVFCDGETIEVGGWTLSVEIVSSKVTISISK